MSRSKRRRPFAGITTAESEKLDKQKANRRHRRMNKQRLLVLGEEALRERKEVSNSWAFAKDGKTRFDPKRRARLMRK